MAFVVTALGEAIGSALVASLAEGFFAETAMVTLGEMAAMEAIGTAVSGAFTGVGLGAAQQLASGHGINWNQLGTAALTGGIGGGISSLTQSFAPGISSALQETGLSPAAARGVIGTASGALGGTLTGAIRGQDIGKSAAFGAASGFFGSVVKPLVFDGVKSMEGTIKNSLGVTDDAMAKIATPTDTPQTSLLKLSIYNNSGGNLDRYLDQNNQIDWSKFGESDLGNLNLSKTMNDLARATGYSAGDAATASAVNDLTMRGIVMPLAVGNDQYSSVVRSLSSGDVLNPETDWGIDFGGSDMAIEALGGKDALQRARQYVIQDAMQADPTLRQYSDLLGVTPTDTQSYKDMMRNVQFYGLDNPETLSIANAYKNIYGTLPTAESVSESGVSVNQQLRKFADSIGAYTYDENGESFNPDALARVVSNTASDVGTKLVTGQPINPVQTAVGAASNLAGNINPVLKTAVNTIGQNIGGKSIARRQPVSSGITLQPAPTSQGYQNYLLNPNVFASNNPAAWNPFAASKGAGTPINALSRAWI